MTSPRKSRDPKTLRPATQLIHGGSLRSSFEETSEALFLTQGYLYDTMELSEARFKGEDPGFIYSRFANPTVSMFEQRMALLEGAEAARATASGMAAVTASLMGQLKAGDHIVAARALFGSCLYVVEELLPRFGVASTLVDGADLDAWRAALRPNTKTAFLESPTNPTLELVDIAGVAEIMHGAGATLDGQGRVLGGVILASEKFIADHIHNFLRQTGPCLSPFNAWTLLKSLETLRVRVAEQTRSAGAIADFLSQHPAVVRTLYPGRADHPQAALAQRQMEGGGTMVAFEVAGGKAAAFRVANAFSIIGISNNLGDAKSLITHPETTTHQRLKPEQRTALGIAPGLLRLSVGLEDVDDLIEDLAQALDKASLPRRHAAE
jgi:O-succinylhomoserine sulfhydrylase